MKKIYTFRGPNSKNCPPAPKNGIRVPKLVWSCDISIYHEFNVTEENIHFWGSKRQKLAPRAQKRNLGPKSVLSNENIPWSKKKYTIHGRKSENQPSEPKNRT
jgi:hypothetical protein